MPEPAETQNETEEKLDDGLSILFETTAAEIEKPAEQQERGLSLTEAIDPTTPTPEPAKPDEKKDEPKKDEPKPEEKAPEEKPIKARRKKKELPPLPEPEPAPAPPVAPKPAEPAAEEAVEANLLEEEREQLELARYAEKKFPEKHKGLGAKVLKFMKDHAAYLEAARKQDPTVSFDADNEDYQAWLQRNKVSLSPRDVRALELEKVRDEVRTEAERETSSIREELYRRDEEPKIKREADTFYTALAQEAVPEELREAIAKDGAAKAKAAFPVEYRIASEVTAGAAADVEEFLRITRKNPATGKTVKPYDPNNEQHVRLLNFITKTCADFEQWGGDHRMRDGKRFVDRETFFKLPAEKRARYWTFSNKELIDLVKISAKERIKERIEAEYKAREEEGFVRKPREAAASAPPPPPPTSTPPPRPSAIPAKPNGVEDDGVDKSFSILMGGSNS